jgi:WD40 repeat protein
MVVLLVNPLSRVIGLVQFSQYFHRYGSQVNSITFSSDGKWIVSGYKNGRVCLWDMQNSTLAPPLKKASFVSPAFSPDSKGLA